MADTLYLQQVCKAYGSQQVLKNLNATLPGGKISAIMGPSGSGKTTLVRLLLGLEQPDSGKISTSSGLLPSCSCVFQENRLAPALTGPDNIALVLPKSQWGQILPALEFLGLHSQDLNKPASELSGGQRRRVALVRAIQANSRLLVLDEPFTGLDNSTREKAYHYLKSNQRQRTVVLVTHNLEEAQALDAQNNLLLLHKISSVL